MVSPATTNILLSSFPGLNLPKTLVIPVPSCSTVGEVFDLVSEQLPFNLFNARLYLTTSDNKHLRPQSQSPLLSLIPATVAPDTFPPNDATPSLLSLRLSAPLCGGKGGFGSQLRAAGGKMSSRKKRNQGDNNGSSRNLDGRRLRTVNEAKALAEYLAVKPEMEKKEREERRKRWEAIIEAADRKEAEIRDTQEGKGKARVDGKWVEDKEEQEHKMREAIERAMARGLVPGMGGVSSDESVEGSEEESESDEVKGEEEEMGDSKGKSSTTSTQVIKPTPVQPRRKIHGWDEDEDEDGSDSDA